MKQEDKLKIVDKARKRTEAKILKNKGETFNFGDSQITIKELSWVKADTLEEKFMEIIKGIQDIFKQEIDDEKLAQSLIKSDIASIIDKFRSLVLKEGLLELAAVISDGQITMETIEEHEATKKEVITIVVDGLLLNYGYVKNLIPLMMGGLR